MALSTKVKKISKVHPFDRIDTWKVPVPVTMNYIPWEPGEVYSLDVEDDEQDGFVGIGMSNGKQCCYFSDLHFLRGYKFAPFIAHNGMSDIRKLQKWGFKVDESNLVWDTQLMGHILDSSLRTYGLKDMVKRDLGVEYPSYEEITGKKGSKGHKTLKDFPVEAVASYNACDCLYTYRLYEKQVRQISGVR